MACLAAPVIFAADADYDSPRRAIASTPVKHGAGTAETRDAAGELTGAISH